MGPVVELQPDATSVLTQVLDVAEHLDVVSAVVVESLAYSTLLSGPAFAAWLKNRPRRPVPPCSDPVHVRRSADWLTLTLNRPERRNALGVQVREGLLDALAVATADPSISRVSIRGAGPTFCAGGDLDEFGTAPDPVTAHRTRIDHHPGLAVHRLADRVVPFLHGACVGAGIEVPAFASHVVAAPGTTFALPELAMGLIPGAGGTVSISRRIGRDRLEWWLHNDATLDLTTALEWGLVDEVGT